MNEHDVQKTDLRRMEPVGLDAEIRKLIAERAERTREVCRVVGSILEAAPLQWVDEGDRTTLELGLPEPTFEALRDLCEPLTGLDGHQLDDELLIGMLALAVLRGGLP